MSYIRKTFCLFVFCLLSSCATFPPPSPVMESQSLVEVTPGVIEYVSQTVRPIIAAYPKKDNLSRLLKVSEILMNPETGVSVNRIEPSKYIIYDKLDKIKLGGLISFRLSSQQKANLKDWQAKYMRNNSANVYFAPSADEVIRNKAAFGCSHYARAFIAVVKALGMISEPENLRYAISCMSDNYNKALEKLDGKMIINGHQFVLVKIDSKWIGINTSKSEWIEMPEGFSPDHIAPPNNVPLRFASYPEVTFLLRKIGKDYDDDCRDNSLTSLMNIYRSGNAHSSAFKWEKFVDSEMIIEARDKQIEDKSHTMQKIYHNGIRHFNEYAPDKLVGDKAYDSDKLDQQLLDERGVTTSKRTEKTENSRRQEIEMLSAQMEGGASVCLASELQELDCPVRIPCRKFPGDGSSWLR